MNGQDFLTLAKRLATGSTEAEWRTAVSRAYYAAFHVARSLFKDLGFTVARGERAHIYVGRRLANAGNQLVQRAGCDLIIMRGDRNSADYDFDHHVGQALAATIVQASEQIVQCLEFARDEPTRAHVLETMKIYERDILKEPTWRP